jgi:hypothetical protein
MVFWEARLVFLATPKAGSTAIEAALGQLSAITVIRPPVLKHTPAYRYQRFVRNWLENSAGAPFTAVALMREPVAWLGSWYRYRSREDIDDPERSTAGMDFETFVNGYLSNPRPAFADVGEQAKFLTHKDALGVDMLFRYEDIGALVEFLEDRIGCEILLPQLNVSPEGDTALSEATLRRMQRRMAADFELYGRIPPGGALAGPPRD